jgi:hypothetical protein
MHRLITLVLFLTTIFNSVAQSVSGGLDQKLNDGLRRNDKLNVVVAILGIIFLIITTYLIYQDIRLKKIEKDIHNNQTPK